MKQAEATKPGPGTGSCCASAVQAEGTQARSAQGRYPRDRGPLAQGHTLTEIGVGMRGTAGLASLLRGGHRPITDDMQDRLRELMDGWAGP